MKRVLSWVMFILIFLTCVQSAGAAKREKIAVLPFAVHSSEDLSYVKSGVWDMLISRLSAGNDIEIIDKFTVNEALDKLAKRELNLADVYALGQKLEADYVVWGSITKIGSSVSLDGKLLDVAKHETPVGIFEQSRGLDEVIPKVNDFSKRINNHVSGHLPAAFEPLPAVADNSFPKSEKPQIPALKAEEALKTSRGTFTSIINPDFINESTILDRKGFWMSERFPTAFKGMDVGDVNGDGLNEVVLIDDYNVMIYQKKQSTLTLLKKFSGRKYDNYLALDVADINDNGIKEIIVTNYVNGILASFVLEFRNGDYETIASDLRYFLRVIDHSEKPLLLGQKMMIGSPFGNPIYEMIWKNESYVQNKRMDIPQGLSVYGLTIDSIDGSNLDRIIALNEYDHLCVYKKTGKPLSQIEVFGGSDYLIWKSAEVFGGSNNYFQPLKLDEQSADTSSPDNIYIKMRILTYDINKNGKNDIVIVKNLSSVGRMFKNLKMFSASEIYNLEWDGIGLLENWKTKKIQGYVADYQFKDIDNDGKNEVVLAIVIARAIRSRSMVVAYDLNVE